MKSFLIITVALLVAFTSFAQTPLADSVDTRLKAPQAATTADENPMLKQLKGSVEVLTQADAKPNYGNYELYISGDGTAINTDNEFGLSVGISTNPFKKLPNLWLGVSQGLFWQPQFAGTTDFDVQWSFSVWKDKVFVNPGWSVGAVYDKDTSYFRTGPELEVEYYLGDDVFLYVQPNYYFNSKGKGNGGAAFGVAFAF